MRRKNRGLMARRPPRSRARRARPSRPATGWVRPPPGSGHPWSRCWRPIPRSSNPARSAVGCGAASHPLTCSPAGASGTATPAGLRARGSQPRPPLQRSLRRIDGGPNPYRKETSCEKPAPGMLLDLMEALGFPPGETVAVGNSWKDRKAARAAGVRFIPAHDFFKPSKPDR